MRGASGGAEVETGAAASADGDIAAGGCGWTRHKEKQLYFPCLVCLGFWKRKMVKQLAGLYFGPG
jgi:hypothetical protein